MNLILLYGPGEAAKRDHLLKLRTKFETVTVVDLKQQDTKAVVEATQSLGLFDSSDRLVILENCPKSFSVEVINSTDPGLTIAVVAPSLEVSSTLLKSAKKANAQLNNFEAEKEVTVFPYLDSLIEQKNQAFIELDQLLQVYGGIYILTMIYYLIRRNILPLPTSPFMQKRISQQKKLINQKQLDQLYKETLETDFALKSGLVEERVALTTLTQKWIGRSDR